MKPDQNRTKPEFKKKDVRRIIKRCRLPDQYTQYLLNLLDMGVDGLVMDSLREKPEDTLEIMQRRFERCCAITGLTPDKLFEASDVGMNDIKVDRLDSFWAELRSICYLDNESFGYIEYLRARKDKTTVDIKCKRDGHSFCFDVACGTFKEDKAVMPAQIPERLKNKYDEKWKQLIQSKGEFGSENIGIIYVLNAEPVQTVCDLEKYKAMLREVHGMLDDSTNVYTVIVDGVDDTNYPAWPVGD